MMIESVNVLLDLLSKIIPHHQTSNTFHIILEQRTDDLTICTPKILPPQRDHWWSRKYHMVIHVKSRGHPDIYMIDSKGARIV